MISLRSMRMEMDGNRDGTRSMSPADVFAEGYMIAPESMTINMQMLSVMYGVSKDLTVMLMLPWLENEMDHVLANGAKFTTRSSGVGDVTFSGLYRLARWGAHQFNLNAGLSMPAGSIDKQDDTPMGANQHLPYPMQPGSGTRDPVAGADLAGAGRATFLGRAGTRPARSPPGAGGRPARLPEPGWSATGGRLDGDPGLAVAALRPRRLRHYVAFTRRATAAILNSGVTCQWQLRQLPSL